ncbi:serine/threonine-protein kinase [Streptomyces sp. NPDC018693]|uniref:serine/threonine-protein kinase n=1 Tax=unclassified Streptomyces TaxID=2593676 RepID=UPI0037B86C2E
MSNDRGPGGDRNRNRTVGGRYRLLERIGSGGMGTVWRAHDELVDREVAVKQPRLPGEPGDESHRRAAHRLYREARAASRVDHPCAVSIHDVVVEEEAADALDGLDGLPWIVMELVRGESLHEVLKRGPLEPAEAARIGLAVLGALRAAHAVGIVHRDVKPANVLLGAHGRVVLTDFGIAHVQGEESLTASGEFVGSLEFVAPERMSGRSAGPASDLWSLGVLLYAAVEGWSPFRRTTLESTLAAILAADAPEPKQAGPLGPLLTRLLTKDPAGRPDAAQAEAALEAAVNGEACAGQETLSEPGDWPSADAPSGDPEPQDSSELREFGDDIRTVRLGAERTGPDAASEPVVSLRRPLHRRPVPLALLGGLLVGGISLGTSFLIGADSDAVTGNPASPKPSASPSPSATATPSPAPAGWLAHPEPNMSATLYLPAEYQEFARSGSAKVQPRTVEYSNDQVTVRLTQWETAPGTLMGQAAEHARTWKQIYDNATTRHTSTTFRGWDAVRSESTYGEDEGLRRRLIELLIVTDDERQYELRVESAHGEAEGKEVAALFEAAHDRLRILEYPNS